MALASGRLRHRISLYRPVQVVDEVTGDRVQDWEAVALNVPADIEPFSVREFVAANALQSQITHRIVIRWREGLTADMRIVHGQRAYDAQGWLADPVSGREYLTAPCIDRGELVVTFDSLLTEDGDVLTTESGDQFAAS